MTQTLHTDTHKARKEYNDDGWDWIDEWIRESRCDISDNLMDKKRITYREAKVLVLHRRREKPHRILKGETYQRSQMKSDDHHLYVFRTHTDLVPILNKYSKYIFPDE